MNNRNDKIDAAVDRLLTAAGRQDDVPAIPGGLEARLRQAMRPAAPAPAAFPVIRWLSLLAAAAVLTVVGLLYFKNRDGLHLLPRIATSRFTQADISTATSVDDLRLAGIMSDSAIVATAQGGQKIVRVGDRIEEWRVVEIESQAVILEGVESGAKIRLTLSSDPDASQVARMNLQDPRQTREQPGTPGKVFFQGRLLRDKLPVAACRVWIFLYDDLSFEDAERPLEPVAVLETWTNEQGVFVTPEHACERANWAFLLAEQEEQVEGSPARLWAAQEQLKSVTGRTFFDGTLVVRPGFRYEIPDVTLSPACDVVGTIRMAAGEPVAGHSVYIDHVYHYMFTHPAISPFNKTDGNGNYRFPGVIFAKRDWDVSITVTTPGIDSKQSQFSRDATRLWKPSAREVRVDFMLPSGGLGLSGRVVGPDGAGLSGVRVDLEHREGDPAGRLFNPELGLSSSLYDARTDEEGRFELSHVAEEPFLRLRFERDGFRRAYQEIAAANRDRELRIEMQPLSELVLTLRDAVGSPVVKAEIAGYPASIQDGEMRFHASWFDGSYQDAQGRYVLPMDEQSGMALYIEVRVPGCKLLKHSGLQPDENGRLPGALSLTVQPIDTAHREAMLAATNQLMAALSRSVDAAFDEGLCATSEDRLRLVSALAYASIWESVYYFPWQSELRMTLEQLVAERAFQGAEISEFAPGCMIEVPKDTRVGSFTVQRDIRMVTGCRLRLRTAAGERTYQMDLLDTPQGGWKAVSFEEKFENK